MQIFAYNLAMHLLNKVLPAGDWIVYMITNGIHLNEFGQIIMKIRNLKYFIINKNNLIRLTLTRTGVLEGNCTLFILGLHMPVVRFSTH